MKITFITGHLCKERHSLLYELAIDLGKYGAEVTVLSGFPSRGIDAETREYYNNHPIEQISENVVVKRVGSKNGEGKGLFGRMIKYLSLTKKLYKEAKKTPTDAYYIFSSPPFLGWMGAKLSKFAPTLYNAQDLFPDTLKNIKGYKEKNPLISFLRHKEKQVYKKNTRIVTISNEMKKTILSAGCDEGKVDVIYNWADTDSLCHIERGDNALMDELGIDKSKFIVSYAGDIGLFQGWNCILDAAKIVLSKKDDINFEIIGSGSYKEQLTKRVTKENISNVRVHPIQSSSRLSEIYSIGDIELVSIAPGISKMSLPSKTFVIMACGSALLTLVDQSSDITSIIKERNLGYTTEHGDAEKLADLILEAYENKDALPKMGKNAREFAKENNSRQIQTKKYYDILKELAESGK